MSNNTRVRVFGDEDRTYMWYSGMTPDELVNWWQSIEKSPRGEEDLLVLLPQGTWHVAEYKDEEIWTIHVDPEGSNLEAPDYFIYMTAEGWPKYDEEVANE